MLYIKKLIRAVSCSLIAASTIAISGCGGGGYWDEFIPRTATVSDFASHSYNFDWVPSDNPIDPDLGAMKITFGTFDGSGNGTFKLETTDTNYVEGTCKFTTPHIELKVTSKTGTVPMDIGQQQTLLIEAEDSDQRIRLTNESTGASLASKK